MIVIHAYGLQCLVRPKFNLGAGKSEIFRSETHIRKNIFFKQLMLGILKYQPHLASQCLFVVPFGVDIYPVIIYPSAGRGQKRIKMSDER